MKTTPTEVKDDKKRYFAVTDQRTVIEFEVTDRREVEGFVVFQTKLLGNHRMAHCHERAWHERHFREVFEHRLTDRDDVFETIGGALREVQKRLSEAAFNLGEELKVVNRQREMIDRQLAEHAVAVRAQLHAIAKKGIVS